MLKDQFLPDEEALVKVRDDSLEIERKNRRVLTRHPRKVVRNEDREQQSCTSSYF